MICFLCALIGEQCTVNSRCPTELSHPTSAPQAEYHLKTHLEHPESPNSGGKFDSIFVGAKFDTGGFFFYFFMRLDPIGMMYFEACCRQCTAVWDGLRCGDILDTGRPSDINRLLFLMTTVIDS
jgi:hypothetical protein